MPFTVIVNAVDLPISFTQDQWVIRNGGVGYEILKASKTDDLVQYFYEAMKATPIVIPDNPRTLLAYGYFVGAGIVSQEDADRICMTSVTPFTKSEAEAALHGIA